MTSAVVLAIFVSIFFAMTKFWAAWYCLSSDADNKIANNMSIIMAGPRFFVMIGTLFFGMWVLDWDSYAQGWFVGITFAMWVLLTTGEVMYVQTKLRKKKEDAGRTVTPQASTRTMV